MQNFWYCVRNVKKGHDEVIYGQWKDVFMSWITTGKNLNIICIRGCRTFIDNFDTTIQHTRTITNDYDLYNHMWDQDLRWACLGQDEQLRRDKCFITVVVGRDGNNNNKWLKSPLTVLIFDLCRLWLVESVPCVSLTYNS